MIPTTFNEAWTQLDKIYRSSLNEFLGTADFNAPSPDSQFYHFMPSFSVLLNALDNEVIYSLANVKGSQLDLEARKYDDAGYVCLLQGVEGKQRITTLGTALSRPWGLSFRDVPDLCRRNGLIFPGTKFNQVANKRLILMDN